MRLLGSDKMSQAKKVTEYVLGISIPVNHLIFRLNTELY